MPAAITALSHCLGDGDETGLAHLLGRPPPPLVWGPPLERFGPRSVASVLWAAQRAPQPGAAVEGLLELARTLGNSPGQWHRDGLRALAMAAGASEAVRRYLVARPELALPLIRGRWVRQTKPGSQMRDELRQLRVAAGNDESALQGVLATYRVGEWIRIVARDLSRMGSLQEILTELSCLANVVVDAATRFHLRRERSDKGPRLERGPRGQPAGFCVIALGKLGSYELNVSSDIDVMFVYSSDDTPEGAELTLHQRHTAVARRIMQTVGRRGAAGFAYRVDTDLRPEGNKGPLANSVIGCENYYEAWGQSWERLALIRARHLAGAAWVSTELLSNLCPFVFPRSFDSAGIDEIRALKNRLHQERRASTGHRTSIDIKRDQGCIREIELFVHILQLLHGGRNPGLRHAPLLEAIDKLSFAGLLNRHEREVLSGAYGFLRRLENVLQAHREQQTQALPEDEETLNHLARAFGMRSRRLGQHLLRQLNRNRRAAIKVTTRLFGDVSPPEYDDAALAALSVSETQRLAGLTGLGFRDVETAADLVSALTDGAGGPFSQHSPERQRAVAAPLLTELSKTPDPDQALRVLVDLDRRLRHLPSYSNLFAAAPLRHRVVELLGSSEFLGRSLVRYPELIDWFSTADNPTTLARRIGVSGLEGQMRQRLSGLDDLELQLRSLRRFKLREQLRIGVLDLGGNLNVNQVLVQLCDLAEACLRQAHHLAWQNTAAKMNLPESGFVVLGMGRFGGGEMGYGSDLDIIFIYDGEERQADEHVMRRASVRLAQRLIQQLSTHYPEGILYAIDTRLRPSGNQGPLVSSATGFSQYHRERAMLWERQALLCARPVAGDLAFGQRLLEELYDVRYPARLAADASQEIHRVRERMEKEVAKETAARFNVKTGRGGLVDLAFIVQFLQLKHAHRKTSLRVPGTLAALNALGKEGLLSERRHRRMQKAYGFLRFLENRLRMVHDRSIGGFLMDDTSLEILARRMGYGAGRASRLRQDYERTTEAVRRLYDKILRPPGR